MGEARQKAGVMSVATTVIATGAARLADGGVYVGGALLATGLALFGLYEVYLTALTSGRLARSLQGRRMRVRQRASVATLQTAT